MLTKKGLYTLLLLLFCLITTAMAAPVKVGIVQSAPFAKQNDNGYTGLSVAIWKSIAKDQHISYQFVDMGNDVEKGINAVKQGKIDVLLGPIDVTAKNINKVNFSRPYFVNQLALITLTPPKGFWSTIKHIVKDFALGTVIFCFVLSFIFSIIICFYEYRQFEGPTFSKSRFWLECWNAIVVLFTLGFIREPQTTAGRIASIFWLIISLGFTSVFSAAITSALTISSSNLELSNNVSETMVAHKRVAVVKGSYAAYVGKDLGAIVVPVDKFGQAIDALRARRVDAVLDSYATIKYERQLFKQDDLHLYRLDTAYNEIAFALSDNKVLQNKVNKALTYFQDHHFVEGLCQKYLAPKDVRACVI